MDCPRTLTQNLVEEYCHDHTVADPVYRAVITARITRLNVRKSAIGFELRSEQTAMLSYKALNEDIRI